MNNKTINDAIIQVLKAEKRGLTAFEIYTKIIEQKLYEFKSATPVHIVLTQLRRGCEGLNLKSANKDKYYRILSDGTYNLK